MRTWRGIAEKEIIDSIEEAAKFLRALNIGPLSNQALQELLESDALAQMKKAPDNDAFVASFLALDTNIIDDLADALIYHALADSEGRGEQILLNLDRFISLVPLFERVEFSKIEDELTAYLETLPVIKYKTIEGFTKMGGLDYYYLSDPEIEKRFPYEDHLNYTGYAATSERKTYQNAYELLKNKVKEVLAHWIERQEIGDTIIAGVSLEPDLPGLHIRMPSALAQQVANLFPEHTLKRGLLVGDQMLAETIRPQAPKTQIQVQQAQRATAENHGHSPA